MAKVNINRQSWAWSVDTGDAAAKLVLLFLAERADGTDYLAWPKISTIAEATGLSERTVKDRLNRLVEAGIIEDTGDRKGRTKQTKVWRLLIQEKHEKDAPGAPLKGESPASFDSKGCTSCTTKGASPAPLKGAPRAPSYIDHSIRDHSIGTQDVARQPKAADAPQPKIDRTAEEKKPTTQVWEAYAAAYQQRYGADPIRNAKVNGQLSHLIKQVGLERAIALAANYPFHPDAYYTKRMHPVDLLLADAQKLYTELQTGQVMTWQRAQQQERVQQAAMQAHQARAIQQQPNQAEERF